MSLHRAFWLALSVAVSLGFALRTSRLALTNPLVVHDDVRQHVFWVPQLHNPALFAGDWIADYYQAQAPMGYWAVYWVVTLLVDAVTASKLIPLVLTVVLAAAGFALGRALWKRPEAAAVCAVLLVWSAWQYDDVASATPRAYALPLLTIQLAALAAGRRRLALAVLPLQAVFYPLVCALAAVTLGGWAVWRHCWGEDRAQRRGFIPPPALLRELLMLAAVTVVSLVLVGVEQLPVARYGPTVSGSVASTMSEFQQGGRAAYFVPGWYRFWLESSRSGFALGPTDPLLSNLPALTTPFVLALALAAWVLAGRTRWIRGPAVPVSGVLLLVVVAGSLMLYAAAHALLFILYLPSRHVQFSLPLVWSMAGGLFWALLGDRLADLLGARAGALERVGLSGAEAFALLGIGLLALHPPPPGEFYVVGRHPAIYAYLRQTPPETLVAALPSDSNIVPLFGQRGVLTSYEHLLPYQPGYYEPLRQRTDEFRSAYFAPTLAPLVTVIQRYGVGVVIADADVLDRRRRTPLDPPLALGAVLEACGVLRERALVVVPASCIVSWAELGP